MTYDEAIIIQKFQLPVLITHNADNFEQGEYRIGSIERSYIQWKKEYVYSAGVKQNERYVYLIPLSDLEIIPELREALNAKLEDLNRKRLKVCIKDLLDKGENKTGITKIIKSLIDEIKGK